MSFGDGSWDLQLLVTDLQVERVLRVRGGEHIGGVMIKLVDMLDIAMDWSDHAVWWPARNTWLTNTRSGLSYESYFSILIKNLFFQIDTFALLLQGELILNVVAKFFKVKRKMTTSSPLF